jgi:hypothetical protein
MKGRWYQRKWWVSDHFMLTDSQSTWFGEIRCQSACGVTMSLNQDWKPEQDISTGKRCSRCEQKLSLS